MYFFIQIKVHIFNHIQHTYYLLSNLYKESGNNQQAILMAEKVLKKEPKVQSTAVNEMREKMRVLI